jgi:hypothetical protein
VASCGGQGANPNDWQVNPSVCTVQNPGKQAFGSCTEWEFTLSGSVAQCGADDAGNVPLSKCQELCASAPSSLGTLSSCMVSLAGLQCVYGCAALGRRPSGLRASPVRERRTIPRFLATAAFLEAASVPAFERLARELAAHGAPRALRTAVRRAASDEIRHAAMMGELAAKAGAAIPAPRVKSGRTRSLERIASENAIEGCVRETFAAAVALVQAHRADDPEVRAVMRRIAADELRHANLSWRVASWIEPRLDAAARKRMRAARGRAVTQLIDSVSREPAPALVTHLGVPTRGVAMGIVKALSAALWA